MVFDAQHLVEGPLAAVHLPFKLRVGLHGNFVDQRDIEAWEERKKVNPVRPAEGLMDWQKRMADGINGHADGSNGVH